MSLYNGPPRGGNRGGKDQFSWDFQCQAGIASHNMCKHLIKLENRSNSIIQLTKTRLKIVVFAVQELESGSIDRVRDNNNQLLILLQIFQFLSIVVAAFCYFKIVQNFLQKQNVTQKINENEAKSKYKNSEPQIKLQQHQSENLQEQQQQISIYLFQTCFQAMILTAIVLTSAIIYLKNAINQKQVLKQVYFLLQNQLNLRNVENRGAEKDQIRVKLLRDEFKQFQKEINSYLEKIRTISEGQTQTEENLRSCEESVDKLSTAVSKQVSILQYTLKELKQLQNKLDKQ
eukprot:TRINITY_DN5559_c0_g1_i4.p2 TRINITY_DN5559_c0_g1~~TRINITY_DN5559_c0_g1_i4.p2  ORF type:complete len:288 (-),score=23.21 TRINITY_DN5559_c0_g1_i4:177-1040(-)